jgi:hypothetical protein
MQEHCSKVGVWQTTEGQARRFQLFPVLSRCTAQVEAVIVMS